MIWFHTLFLPIATLFAVLLGIKNKVPPWKHGALVVGCGLMLCGLWLRTQWRTPSLIAGGALFVFAVPRPVINKKTS